MNRVAMKIRDARKKSGLTEKELAKKCGLSASYIIQIESGKKIINEKAADNILKTLGEKAEMLEDTSARQEVENMPKSAPKAKAPASYSVEPNAQWESALAGVLKKYPVYDCVSGKVVNNKELPIINRKVEGHNPDRLMFIQASNDEMEVLRIQKNDIVMVMETKEIQNDNIYLLEIDKVKLMRKVRKENNVLKLSRTGNRSDAVTVDVKRAKVLGKCIKVEYSI